MAGAPSAERSWSSNDAHDPPSHDIELHSAALSDGGLPSGPGKDTTRLLEQQEDGTDKCVGVTCKPQVSSLAAASLGVNGIFFGMLIVLSVTLAQQFVLLHPLLPLLASRWPPVSLPLCFCPSRY